MPTAPAGGVMPVPSVPSRASPAVAAPPSAIGINVKFACDAAVDAQSMSVELIWIGGPGGMLVPEVPGEGCVGEFTIMTGAPSCA